jgi:uncharacterized protein (TIGR02452 family)
MNKHVIRSKIFYENIAMVAAQPKQYNVQNPIKCKVAELCNAANTINFDFETKKKTNIFCMAGTSNQAINHYAKTHNVSVLNFASASSCGGGYSRGAMAQEEELCRTILGLYESLCTDLSEWTWYRDINYSVDLKIWRKDYIESNEYKLITNKIDQSNVSVITASAPNMNSNYIKNQFEKNPTLILTSLKNLIKASLTIPIVANKKSVCNQPSALILGAFGCGVFAYNGKVPKGTEFGGKNYNETVALLFQQVITENPQLTYCYDVICFAIPDENRKDSNYDSFKKVFV